jgi:hypothetical protein
MAATRIGPAELSLQGKLRHLNWSFVAVVILTALVGYAMLYSAGGGAHAPGPGATACALASGSRRCS